MAAILSKGDELKVISLALGESNDCTTESEANMKIWLNRSNESTMNLLWIRCDESTTVD